MKQQYHVILLDNNNTIRDLVGPFETRDEASFYAANGYYTYEKAHIIFPNQPMFLKGKKRVTANEFHGS